MAETAGGFTGIMSRKCGGGLIQVVASRTDISRCAERLVTGRLSEQTSEAQHKLLDVLRTGLEQAVEFLFDTVHKALYPAGELFAQAVDHRLQQCSLHDLQRRLAD